MRILVFALLVSCLTIFTGCFGTEEKGQNEISTEFIAKIELIDDDGDIVEVLLSDEKITIEEGKEYNIRVVPQNGGQEGFIIKVNGEEREDGSGEFTAFSRDRELEEGEYEISIKAIESESDDFEITITLSVEYEEDDFSSSEKDDSSSTEDSSSSDEAQQSSEDKEGSSSSEEEKSSGDEESSSSDKDNSSSSEAQNSSSDEKQSSSKEEILSSDAFSSSDEENSSSESDQGNSGERKCVDEECARFEPEEGKVLMFMGQDLNAIGGVESWTAEKSGWQRDGSSGYMDDSDLPKPSGITSYTNTLNWGLWEFINWGSGDLFLDEQLADEDFDNMPVTLGYYLNGDIDNIINGAKDTELNALADYFISIAPRPVYFRPGYEFNYQTGGYKDGYVKAWIYMYELFEEKGVDNVAWVWQSNGAEGSLEQIEGYYPGDEYVDWVGYSYFLGGGKVFMDPEPGTVMLEFAREHKKPAMINEACANLVDLGLASDQEIAEKWFAKAFKHVQDNKDVVKGFAYINIDWKNQYLWINGGDAFFWSTTDSRIQINEAIKNIWIDEMKKDHWLLYSNDMFDYLYSN